MGKSNLSIGNLKKTFYQVKNNDDDDNFVCVLSISHVEFKLRANNYMVLNATFE